MSTSGSGLVGRMPPTMQADATLAQANPVSGTLYTVLATTANVRIISAVAKVTWTVQPTPLEIHILIDGIQNTYSFTNPVTATWYEVYTTPRNPANTQSLVLEGGDATRTGYRSFFKEGKSVMIQAETTGGTVQNLDARVKYAKW